MMHLSDRRRVELALPANLLHRMVTQCIGEGIRTEDDREIIAQFQRSALAALDGLNRREAFRVVRRVERAADLVMSELRGHAHATAFLALVLWIRDMLADGTLELIEGSDFDTAIEAVIATLTEAPDVVAAVDRSATKAASRIASKLDAAGYYPGHRREAAE